MPIPDQTVKVSFNPPDENSWVFTPSVVTMTAAGRIILLRDPHSPNWTFVSVNLLPASWETACNPSGSQLTVNDPDEPKGEFVYTVTVLYQGVEYTSPEANIGGEVDPPIIMNE
jgi:hypothetical protein